MKNPLPCFVCGKELMHAVGGGFPGEVVSNQPLDALAFDSKGHYGSRLFDQIHRRSRWTELELCICEPCLVERAERVREVYLITSYSLQLVNPEDRAITPNALKDLPDA